MNQVMIFVAFTIIFLVGIKVEYENELQYLTLMLILFVLYTALVQLSS